MTGLTCHAANDRPNVEDSVWRPLLDRQRSREDQSTAKEEAAFDIGSSLDPCLRIALCSFRRYRRDTLAVRDSSNGKGWR